MLAFISPFYGHNPRYLTLIERLRVRLIHLQFDKSKNIFQDTLNTTCNCSAFRKNYSFPSSLSRFSNKRLTPVHKL